MYSGGSGTSGDPYLIANATDLKDIESNMGSSFYFKQIANIILGDFEPIGYGSGDTYTNFQGFYNGDNYLIKDGSIDYSSDNFIGIFAYKYNSGYFKNIIVDNVSVSGNRRVGTICGYFRGASAENIWIKSSCSVLGADYHVGGIFGLAQFHSSATQYIRYCCNEASVEGASNVGGLVGYGYNSTVEYTQIYDCYNTGSVLSSGSYAGGICGGTYTLVSGYNFRMANCYNSGQISAIGYAGGICGNNVRGEVLNSYNFGEIIRISGSNTTFKRIAQGSNALSDNYGGDWLTNPVGGAWSNIGTTDLDGADISLANAKKETTYSSNGWDFSTPVWDINEDNGYPFLYIFPPASAFLLHVKNTTMVDYDDIHFFVAGNGETKYSGGAGTVGDPYLISCAQDFLDIGDEVSTVNVYYSQIHDIDFKNQGFEGYIITGFDGKYKGNNFKFKNYSFIYNPSTGNTSGGTFGSLGSGGVVIENITFSNVTFDSEGLVRCGFLASNIQNANTGVITISNILVESSCSINITTLYPTNSRARIGGIVAVYYLNSSSRYDGTLNISLCTNKADITINDTKHNSSQEPGIGGIVGYVGPNLVYGSLNISDCKNEGELVSHLSTSGYSYCGGILGHSASNKTGGVTITRSINTGNLSGYGAYTNGILGIAYNKTVTITDCYALNSSITKLGSTSAFYRIGADYSASEGISDCYGLDTMTLPRTPVDDKDDTDGEDITAANAKKEASYSAFTFDDDNWRIDEDSSYPYIDYTADEYPSGGIFKVYINGSWETVYDDVKTIIK